MRTREMSLLKKMLPTLTPSQRREVQTELNAHESCSGVVAVIEGVAGERCACRHCGSEKVIRHGTEGGLQRFLCKDCGRTFNALTGTPLARLRMKGKWVDQARSMQDGLTIHQSADRLHVAPSTAFRWRHRFLALPRTLQAQWFTGIVEMDETFVLESFKGQRGLVSRAPRKRGGKASKRGVSKEQIPVLVARDRDGKTANFILEADNAENVVAVMKPRLASDAILCMDGSHTLAAAAKRMGAVYRPVNLSAGVRVIAGVFHIQNVNAYDSRYKQWMQRFKGIATKYLDNYLGWFRAIDRPTTAPMKPASFLALSLSA